MSCFVIRDPKQRTICVTPLRDRVVHHTVIDVLEQIFEVGGEAGSARSGWKSGSRLCLADGRVTVIEQPSMRDYTLKDPVQRSAIHRVSATRDRTSSSGAAHVVSNRRSLAAAVVQRTRSDAARYLRKVQGREFMGGGVEDIEFALNDPRSTLSPEQKQELLSEYQKNAPPDQQPLSITASVPVPVAAEPEVPQHDLTDEEIAGIWTKGRYGSSHDNACVHYQKHVIQQNEFGGPFAMSLSDYVRAAKAFSKRSDPGVITTTQGGKGLAMSWDSSTGRGEFLVLDGSDIATYFELSAKVGYSAPLEQIQARSGLSTAQILELTGGVSTPAAVSAGPPRQGHGQVIAARDGYELTLVEQPSGSVKPCLMRGGAVLHEGSAGPRDAVTGSARLLLSAFIWRYG